MIAPILIDIPTTAVPTNEVRQGIKWCDGHWSELMLALQDRGLTDQIASTHEELNEKLVAGRGDPCWEAFNLGNIGGLQTFGIEKILGENAGCPVCAFSNMVSHLADLVTVKYGESH